MELSIDTSTRYAAVGVSVDGRCLVELAWRSEQNHSVELVPAMSQAMQRAGTSASEITAVFVAIGPGGFSALRVGLSTAKALARARKVPLVGVGTLHVEAAPYLGLGVPVQAVMDGGRSKLYTRVFLPDETALGERPDGPLVLSVDEIIAEVVDETIFCGEGVDGDVRSRLLGAIPNVVVADAARPTRRAAELARLGHRRLSLGESDDPGALEPVYARGSQWQKAQQHRIRTGGV